MNKFFSILILGLLLSISPSYAQLFGKKKPKDFVVIMKTEFGEVVMMCYDVTPKHKANFLKLVSEGFYNGTTFHRIIDNFMVQGGDPNSTDADKSNDGLGGPGYTLPAEFIDTLTHKYGALAAARMGDNVNPEKRSSGSQFYIVENPRGTPHLNRNYTVFGAVIKGMEVIEKIAEQPKDSKDKPLQDIVISMKVKKMRRDKIIKKYGGCLNLPQADDAE
jgi:cyclophilin family peptidyl-prolyl cis-trans isomerase